MHSLIYFVIILISSACCCESHLHESYANSILGFSSIDMKNVFLNNGENLMVSLYNDTEWKTEEKDCECKNGICETVCAAWKNGACYRTKKECVCPPEFVKSDEKTCTYCDCGKGFNCTYDRNSHTDYRICSCPEGYYDYYDKCAPYCSASKPCKNGGTCMDGKCKCKMLTFGPFCEGIFRCAYECRPRLIVDCVYNQEEASYGCLCKNRSLWFDYKEWVCKPCPCGEGTCKYENHKLKCDCKPGYKEFQTQCRTCNCGNEDITCSLDNVGRKICKCPKGYEDILGFCEQKKKAANCTCHLPTTNCVEEDEGFKCVCKDGYMRGPNSRSNPDDPCIDIDECYLEKKCPKRNNQRCVNFPGSYMCLCETGYEPISRTADSREIACEKYKPSWLPAGLTIAVIVVFLTLSAGFIIFLKKRESSISQRSGSEMLVRFSR